MIEIIRSVEKIAERSEKEFEALTEAAKQLGKQTELSCNEAHAGIDKLRQLGGNNIG